MDEHPHPDRNDEASLLDRRETIELSERELQLLRQGLRLLRESAGGNSDLVATASRLLDRLEAVASRPVVVTESTGALYRRVLVPLDGSELAEAGLARAAEMARASGAELVLLRVVPRSADVERERVLHYRAWSRARSFEEPEDPNTATALAYLSHVALSLRDRGIAVRTLVEFGPPADTIAAVAAREQADLVVMASHGRSGISRWVYGSVAEGVIRNSQVPVLVVHLRTPAQPLGV